ncbi:hypothetical protein CKF48_10620 [Cytobacillus kochii]|uniref:Uncharacterized protein n=1 Tax=Cytobacillus kochii TaxID=859143 RepID=A0A248THN5_9BACI|nr:hypothetical protein CKF48_10620 [Cytobacillus kochii]
MKRNIDLSTFMMEKSWIKTHPISSRRTYLVSTKRHNSTNFIYLSIFCRTINLIMAFEKHGDCNKTIASPFGNVAQIQVFRYILRKIEAKMTHIYSFFHAKKKQ